MTHTNDIPDADNFTTLRCGVAGHFGGYPVRCERPAGHTGTNHAAILGPLSPMDRTPYGTASYFRADEVVGAKQQARPETAATRNPFWKMYGDNGTEWARE